MRMTRGVCALCSLPILLGACAGSPAPSRASAATPATTPAAHVPAWVARSNTAAQPLLQVLAKHDPWEASLFGVDGYDEQVTDLREGHEERYRAELARVVKTLREQAAAESEPHVQQDLAISIHYAESSSHESEVHERNEVPFHRVPEIVFTNLRDLLDDRNPPARRRAAVARLRRYAGLEPGTTPFVELAQAETLRAFASPKSLMPPSRLEVEKTLQTTDTLVDGIEKLFKKSALDGYEQPLATFKKQIAAYVAFMRGTILPRARTDFRLAPEVYAVALEQNGVDATPEKLIALGHQGFDAIQAEMRGIAAVVGRARNLPSADYRDVIRALKKEQLPPDTVLATYRQRLSDIEAIITREHLVTLPSRPARIRLGSEAENAALPAPHMSVPRFLGNTGEQGEFIVTTSVPPPPGGNAADAMLDDFSYDAVTWTFTAHEARPGHELQFDSVVEHGTSIARAIFALNSANAEGWGLYAEYITYRFMPPEAQLVSLLFRLHRAARAFLDPELQLGKQTPESVRAFLQKEVVLSPGYANSEVERYTFNSPGQATTYYYGFTELLAIRREVEKRLGAKFNLQRFDDFVLDQGFLPPALLREATLKTFVPQGG